MITRFAQWQGREPASLAADTTYGNGEFLHWLLERDITPYMRTRESALKKEQSLLRSRALHLPTGKQQLSVSRRQATSTMSESTRRNRTHLYISTAKRCRDCSQKAQCTSGQYKMVAIHIHEPARQQASELAKTPAFEHVAACPQESGRIVR